MSPLNWINMGIAVVPVFYKSKRPEVSWSQFQTKLPSTAQAATWFRPGRQTNAAVICGWRGLTVLDYDTTTAYLSWLAWSQTTPIAQIVARETYRVQTSRGVHVYVYCDDNPPCGHFAGGDVKGRGGYVLIPPSIHPNGTAYVAINPTAPIMRVSKLADILPDPPVKRSPKASALPPPYAAGTVWPESLIEKIKKSHNILEFFPDARPSGGAGRWYVSRCPWHDDRSPSLRIDEMFQVVMCFSGCTDRPLDVIGVYARLKNLSNKEAIWEMSRGA